MDRKDSLLVTVKDHYHNLYINASVFFTRQKKNYDPVGSLGEHLTAVHKLYTNSEDPVVCICDQSLKYVWLVFYKLPFYQKDMWNEKMREKENDNGKKGGQKDIKE